MESILDVEVSCFQSYLGKEPRPVNLLKWLKSNKYADSINELRQCENKKRRDELKSKLPAITPSGLFCSSRNQENLARHSGLICIDIDPKGNEGIHNYVHLKEEFFNLKNVAYAGLSASGKGFFLLIPITDPMKHKEHFTALFNDFEKLGVIIDKAPKNVASLRGYSYDPNGLFRHDALPYHKTIDPEHLKKKKVPYCLPHPPSTLEESVRSAIENITLNRIDITQNESDWFELACALANEFGESGRFYFHQLSQFHPDYNPKQTDKKFSYALKKPYSYRIGTFFRLVSLRTKA